MQERLEAARGGALSPDFDADYVVFNDYPVDPNEGNT